MSEPYKILDKNSGYRSKPKREGSALFVTFPRWSSPDWKRETVEVASTDGGRTWEELT